jgi:hypothetical protein
MLAIAQGALIVRELAPWRKSVENPRADCQWTAQNPQNSIKKRTARPQWIFFIARSSFQISFFQQSRCICHELPQLQIFSPFVLRVRLKAGAI